MRPSLYTFSDARLHPPFVPTPVTPEAPALFHCLDKWPSHGLAWDVPAPAGSANNLWTHLTIRSSHCAYLIRRCPILVQARKGSTGPSPAPSGPQPPTQSSDLPQPLPQSELSTHYPFPSVAITKPGAAREPLVGPLERAAPHPSAREETTRTSGGRAAQPQPVSQPSPRSLLFSPQRPPSGPPESSRGVGARLCLRPRSAPAERPGRSPAARSSQGPACPPPRRAARARAAPSRDHGPWGPTTASPDAGEVGAAPTALRKPRGTPRT